MAIKAVRMITENLNDGGARARELDPGLLSKALMVR
jgi:hypothetical protein